MVPNNSTKFEIRSQVISGNHWGRTKGWTDRLHIKPNEEYHIINTSPLSVEGYTKPSAELEVNVNVKYVGKDERTDG